MKHNASNFKAELHLVWPDLYSSPNIVRGDKIENEIGMVCSAYGIEEKRIQGFGAET